MTALKSDYFSANREIKDGVSGMVYTRDIGRITDTRKYDLLPWAADI